MTDKRKLPMPDGRHVVYEPDADEVGAWNAYRNAESDFGPTAAEAEVRKVVGGEAVTVAVAVPQTAPSDFDYRKLRTHSPEVVREFMKLGASERKRLWSLAFPNSAGAVADAKLDAASEEGILDVRHKDGIRRGVMGGGTR